MAILLDNNKYGPAQRICLATMVSRQHQPLLLLLYQQPRRRHRFDRTSPHGDGDSWARLQVQLVLRLQLCPWSSCVPRLAMLFPNPAWLGRTACSR